MLDSSAFDIEAALSPVRRSLGLHRAGTWSSRGIAAGAGAGALALVMGRILWGHPPVQLAVAALITGLAVAAALTVRRWPSVHEAARLTDRHFALQDRVTTALEYQHSREPLILLQRRDLARLVDRLPLVGSAPPVANRRDLILAAAALIVFAGALALPQGHAAHRTAVRSDEPGIASIRRLALSHLTTISRDFQAGLTPSQRHSSAARQALAAISSLQTQLRHAQSKEQALREISDAQARLQRAGSLLNPVAGSTARVVTKSMRGFLPDQPSANAAARARQPNQAAAKYLKSLAISAGRQSAGQQQRTAQALMKTANKIPDDQVKTDLRQAASALGHGDTKTAQQALRNAASRFSASQATRRTKSSLSSTRRKLDAVKNDVSGLKRNSTPASDGKNGTRTAIRSKSRLHGGREAAGIRGASPPTTNAKQTRDKNQNTRGGTTETSRNLGNGLDRAGKRAGGRFATVFVPGLVGRGQHVLPIQLQASAKRVPVVPYRQVIAKYGKSARTALMRSALPPSLQTYVRKYFTVLSH